MLEPEDDVIFNQSSGFLTEQEKKQAYELAKDFWASPQGKEALRKSRIIAK